MAEKDFLILVDEKDKQIGTEEKLQAHKKGKIHRALSVLVFNSKGEMLIQKRADSKNYSNFIIKLFLKMD